MKLSVKSLDDNNHEFEIDENSTICVLRQKVAELYGIALSELTLIFGGRVISNSELNLTSIGLSDDCILHMVKKTLRAPDLGATIQTPSHQNSFNAAATNETLNDNLQSRNIGLHTTVTTMSEIPDSILQYINQLDPARSQHRQRAQQLSGSYPIVTTQENRNDELEYTFAKLNGAVDDWNRYYPSYNLYVESDGLIPSNPTLLSTDNNDINSPTRRNFDTYYDEFMRQLSGMLSKLDCLRDVIQSTISKLKTLSEVTINSYNIEDIQFRITSTMNRFCRLMVIFSVMMQQMSSIRFSFNNNEPYNIESSPQSILESIQETTLFQTLGPDALSTNSRMLAHLISDVTIPIIANGENHTPLVNVDSDPLPIVLQYATIMGPTNNSNSTSIPFARNSTRSHQAAGPFSNVSNGNTNNPTINVPTNGPTDSETDRDNNSTQQHTSDYQSILRDIVRPIVNSITHSSTQPANRVHINIGQNQSSQHPVGENRTTNINGSSSPGATIIIQANGSNNRSTYLNEEQHNNMIRSLPHSYRTLLEYDFARCRDAGLNPQQPTKRSFAYLHDISNSKKNIEDIENAKTFLTQPFINIIQNTNEYNSHIRNSQDRNIKSLFDSFFESNEFSTMYRQFLKHQLLELRKKYTT